MNPKKDGELREYIESKSTPKEGLSSFSLGPVENLKAAKTSDDFSLFSFLEQEKMRLDQIHHLFTETISHHQRHIDMDDLVQKQEHVLELVRNHLKETAIKDDSFLQKNFSMFLRNGLSSF